jgi:hypothetical protein
MRRFTLKGWLARELKYLSGEETLNLRRLAYLAQGPCPRLWERLVLYTVVKGQAKQLRAYLYDERLIEKFEAVNFTLSGANLNDPESWDTDALPERYKKALSSFRSAYHSIDTRNKSKRLRWQKTIQLQRQKGVSNAEIYQALGFDAGNINAYLKHGDIDRVTLDAATDIMKYVMTLD